MSKTKKDQLDGFAKWSGRAQVHFMHYMAKKIARERYHKGIAGRLLEGSASTPMDSAEVKK